MIKYEFFTDPREISRKVGLGEQDIADKLLGLAGNLKTRPSVRLEALATAFKFLQAAVEGCRGDR